jgi:GT2 family glycosyltransferase
MDISICVVTHNQCELLRRCVASCVAEIGRAGVSGEIIVVDNASFDRYPEKFVSLSPMVRVLRNEENLGFSAANNQAIRASSGRYVLILNDDAILLPASLQLMLNRLESDSQVGAVGPQLLNADGTLQRNFTHRRFPHLRGVLCQLLRAEPPLEKCAVTRDLLTLSRDLGRTSEADHLASACFLARRRAIEGVGLYDQGFHYLYEDTDLCFRLKQAGWRIVYLPESKVTHYLSASLMKLSLMERSTIGFQSMLRFFGKHTGPARFCLVRLTVAAVMLLRLPTVILFRMWKAQSVREGWSSSVPRTLRIVRMLLTNVDQHAQSDTAR